MGRKRSRTGGCRPLVTVRGVLFGGGGGGPVRGRKLQFTKVLVGGMNQTY